MLNSVSTPSHRLRPRNRECEPWVGAANAAPDRQKIAEIAPMSFFIRFLDGQRAPLVPPSVRARDRSSRFRRVSKRLTRRHPSRYRRRGVLRLDRSQGPGGTVNEVDVSVLAFPQSERHLQGGGRRGAVISSR